MSEFKWVPECGDKFWWGDCKCISTHLDDGGRDHAHLFFNKSLDEMNGFDDGVPSALQPRGKKATKKYDAQKAKWESEQAVEFEVEDYAVVIEDHPHKVFLFGDLLKIHDKSLLISDGVYGARKASANKGITGIRPERLRPATPAEIQAHKDSLTPELKKGDYVYHKDEKNDLTMWRIKSILEMCQSCELKGVDIKGATCQRLLENLRHATPEEIEAHELSLKPSVEQLRIERDAAADALAGYCCGIYPKGENIHLEKFKEAKAAHLQAVGGEG